MQERRAAAAHGVQARATKTRGDEAEARALTWLQARGLRLLQRNYRVAGGPRQRAGEIDLVMQEADGTLVFVEVRSRASGAAGGAAASVSPVKQSRLVRAAQHYLLAWPDPPPCRFDVLAIEGAELQWLKAAFDAG